MRPIIGITQDIEYKKDGKGFWAYLDRHYAEAVYRAGGLPVMVPVLDTPGAAAVYASRIDGLLLSGGDDIHPRYYGEEPGEKVSLSPDLRTDYDFALLREMLALDKPVLGICLGVQAINVYMGGSLHQDVPGHRAEDADLTHEVRIAPEGLLAGIVGAESAAVNSYHHQAIKSVGQGLVAAAHAPDGIVEALELPGRRFVLGVQWHPERMIGDAGAGGIFRAFINACKM